MIGLITLNAQVNVDVCYCQRTRALQLAH